MANLQKIVNELCDRAGLTETEIVHELAALGVSTSQPTINRLKNGTVKRHSFVVGLALMELHRKRVRPVRKAG